MSPRLPITRTALLPDPSRVERAARLPEVGPRILFFTGGTALRRLSRALKGYTHDSVHLMTPFDSGGSSAHLRRAFGMPSVGDLRNRLMALADESVRGNPEITSLFAERLSATASPAAGRARLAALVAGTDPRIAVVPNPMRSMVQSHLRYFADAAPADFDLRDASVGNLVLGGGFLHSGGDLDSVLVLFSRLAEVRGTVRPVVDADLHLAATLEDGTRLVGQHRITGKSVAPITSPIERIELVFDLETDRPARIEILEQVRSAIVGADLVVFPMGSFYTSVLANLLPAGVGRAVQAAPAPKVYVPNTGRDPEQLGLGTADCVRRLLEILRRDAGPRTPTEELLSLVLLHTDDTPYEASVDVGAIEDQGVRVVRTDLLSPTRSTEIDAQRLAQILVSLA